MRTFLGLAAIAAVVSFAPAQATFTQITTTPSPANAGGTYGVSDGAGMLLFAGLIGTTGGNTYSDRLWRFDGANWTDLSPAVSPPGRDFYAACWDPIRARLVVFGGRGTSTTQDLGDTWEWDGTSWTQMAPANTPSPRRWAAMYYDLANARCILFGGNTAIGANTAASYSNETWSWDGTNWTLLTPATSPSARARGFFSYDYTRNRAFYYGGRNTAALGDTWSFDGSNWSQVTTNQGPGSGGIPGLFAYGFTYDPLRDRHVIYGGTRTGGVLNFTWEFDGVGTWVSRGTQVGGPAARTGCSFQFVPGLATSVLWGGFQTAFLGDTWTYQTATFAGANPIGSGCAGTAATPQLVATTQPWTGDTFSMTCSGLSPLGIAFATIGFSTTSWSGGALPFPLAFLTPSAGAGCNLLVSPDSVSLANNVGGTAVISIALPSDPAFAGLQLGTQVAQLEVVPSETISVSNAIAATVGAR